jgi:anthranilate phosphoribosyltransferase
MDELSPSGTTRVAELSEGEIEEYELSPRALGLEPAPEQELAGGTPEENAALIRALLSGKRGGGPLTATLMNAGAAIYVSGRVGSMKEGVGAAARSIDSGAALGKLEALREESHR